METKKAVQEYVLIAFILLAALFGMQIMTFIFGVLGPSASGLPATSVAYNVSQAIQNNSLGAVQTYTAGASNNFTIIGIAITLVILIGIFLLFWKIFVTDKKRKESRGYGGGMSGSFA